MTTIWYVIDDVRTAGRRRLADGQADNWLDEARPVVVDVIYVHRYLDNLWRRRDVVIAGSCNRNDVNTLLLPWQPAVT